MKSKNKKSRNKAGGRASLTKKLVPKELSRAHKASRLRAERREGTSRPVRVTVQPEHAREAAGIKIAVDAIDGTTRVGDLIVVFPRTREVLKRHGLRLEVEEAGDIYMTLETFAAMKGVNTGELIQEVVQVSKEPAQPPAQPPQLATLPPA